jgi:ammonium transporter, Amt family
VLTLYTFLVVSLTGLVSITGSCGVVDFGSAIAIGAVGGLVYLLSERLVIYKMIDDAVGAIPVHLGGGIWGVLSVGLFSSPDLLKAAFGLHQKHFGWIFDFSDISLFGSQILEIVFISGWVAVTMLPLFLMLQYVGWFRVNELEELIGLDTKYIDGEVMNDENSDNDEIIRLAAYRQRFLERKQKREQYHGKDVALSQPESSPVYEL